MFGSDVLQNLLHAYAIAAEVVNNGELREQLKIVSPQMRMYLYVNVHSINVHMVFWVEIKQSCMSLSHTKSNLYLQQPFHTFVHMQEQYTTIVSYTTKFIVRQTFIVPYISKLKPKSKHTFIFPSQSKHP